MSEENYDVHVESYPMYSKPGLSLSWRKTWTALTLFLLSFYWAGYLMGKRAADRWWQKKIITTVGAWPANNISVHPPYSRATVDDLLCGKIGVYVYDHCESEEFYRSKDMPCYDKKGALIAECSKHTDVGWASPKPPEATTVVEHPKPDKLHSKSEPCKEEELGGGYLISNCPLIPGVKSVKIPRRVMLDILNANGGDYGWMNTSYGGLDCVLFGHGAFSRIDDASCAAQDLAITDGKARVEIKKP